MIENILKNLKLEALIQRTVTETIETIYQDLKAEYDTNKEKEILTIDETCELLNLAKPTIYTMTSRRDIPYFKIGKKLCFKRSVLMDWLDKNRYKANEEIQAEARDYVKRNRFRR